MQLSCTRVVSGQPNEGRWHFTSDHNTHICQIHTPTQPWPEGFIQSEAQRMETAPQKETSHQLLKEQPFSQVTTSNIRTAGQQITHCIPMVGLQGGRVAF